MLIWGLKPTMTRKVRMFEVAILHIGELNHTLLQSMINMTLTLIDLIAMEKLKVYMRYY